MGRNSLREEIKNSRVARAADSSANGGHRSCQYGPLRLLPYYAPPAGHIAYKYQQSPNEGRAARIHVHTHSQADEGVHDNWIWRRKKKVRGAGEKNYEAGERRDGGMRSVAETEIEEGARSALLPRTSIRGCWSVVSAAAAARLFFHPRWLIALSRCFDGCNKSNLIFSTIVLCDFWSLIMYSAKLI